jgi:enediyne biosynthesis protein E4
MNGRPRRLLSIIAAGIFLWTVSAVNGQTEFGLSQTFHVFPTTPDGLTGIATADFDKDGHMDIVVGELRGEFLGSADSLAVFFNDGTGGFSFQDTLRFSGGDRILDVVTGDFDNDGWPDIATAMDNNQIPNGSGNGKVQICVSDGSSSKFASPVGFNVAARPMVLVTGDLNGDSSPDIVTGNTHGKATVLINAAQSSSLQFSSITDLTYGSSTDHTHAIHLMDVDGDNDLDLLVGLLQRMEIFVNDGSGSFTSVGSVPGTSVVGITSGDFDGDNLEDFAFVNGGTDEITIGINGGGFFPGPVTLDLNLGAGRILAGAAKVMDNADVDGDGDLDLIVSTRDSVALIINEPEGTFTYYKSFGVGTNPASYKLVLDELDGNDGVDLALIHHGGSNELAVLLNLQKQFAEVAGFVGVDYIGNVGSIAWIDADGDDDLDLSLVNGGSSGAEVNRFYWNLGNGDFIEAPPEDGLNDANDGFGQAWADYDDDGDLDLYVTNRNPVADALYQNNSGTFTDVALDVGLGDPGVGTGPVWFDYDGDGDLDLFLPKHEPPNPNKENRLYRNDGDHFTDVAPGLGINDSGHCTGAAVGRIFGDDILYMMVSRVTSYAPNRLYRIDQGLFTDVTSQVIPVIDSANDNVSEWADYDNDGLLDIYVGNNSGLSLLWHNENGQLINRAAPLIDMAGVAGAATWGDFDLDADLDLYVTRGTDGKLFRNDGGSFTDVTDLVGVTGGSSRAAAWADYDRDGDLDLYFNTPSGPSKLFKNNLNNGNSWLVVEPLAANGLSPSVLARVTATAGGVTQVREIVAGGGGSSPPVMEAHFGLGAANVIDNLTIEWPSGNERTWTNITASQKIAVAESIVVAIPDTVVTYGEVLEIPVRIGGTVGHNIVSAEIFVSYNGDLLAAWSTSETPVSATPMTAAWTIETNIIEGVGTSIDTIKIAMADEVALSGSGDLILVGFDVADLRHPAFSDLKLEHVLLNDGTPGNIPIDGRVTLVGTDGTIVAAPDVIIPRWPITVTVTDADEDRTGAPDGFDVAVVNGAQTEVLAVFETGATSGVFTGTINTVFSLAFSSNNGVVQAKAGDQIVFSYADSLDGSGATASRLDTTDVIGGANGSVRSTVVSQPGDTVRVRVTDADLSGSVQVTVENGRTAEVESVLLSAFSPGSSIFFGSLSVDREASAGGIGDGALNALKGDSLLVTYADTLTAQGGTADSLAHNYVVDPFGDAHPNGQVQAFDAAKVLQHRLSTYAGGAGTLMGMDSLSANVDLQAPYSIIDGYDASWILRKVVSRISRFPVQTDSSANHPQPETDQSAPKLVPDERLFALQEGDGYVSVWVDDRTGILSGELAIEGLSGRLEMAPELGDFLSVARSTEAGLHAIFAGAGTVSGPGELLRVYSGAGPEEARLIRASFNGGRIIVRPENVERVAVPRAMALHPNVPNPFNPETSIRFDLPAAAAVRLELFDVLGQRVRRLVSEGMPAGSHRVQWDGRDDAGIAVGSGVYFYRLRAGENFQQMRRMLLLK